MSITGQRDEGPTQGGTLLGSTPSQLARALALPHRVEFAPNLLGLWFPLMKILPALKLVEAAGSGAGIIETSSGTMALALAMVCAAQDRPLTLVTPPLEASLRRHLDALGRLTVAEVAEHDLPGGNQAARLRRIHAILKDRPDLSWTRQYENPLVLEAYEPAGRMLAESGIDCLVAPVGSGGSALGMIRTIRQVRPEAKLVAVDAMNSVLFGRPDGPRKFPGLGNSVVPPLFDHTAFDAVHWLTDDLMAACTRETARRTGLLLGPSGGAALLVARWLARRHQGMRVACVLPDQGTRYLETVYRDVCASPSGMRQAVQHEPIFITRPPEKGDGWQAMRWERRSLRDR